MPGKSNKFAPPARRYATVAEAADYVGVNPLSIRNWIKDGRLRAYNGASWRVIRVDLNELDRLMEGGK